MTTGLDGLLDIRQKNDMLNALKFLVEYTGTALLSWAGPGKESGKEDQIIYNQRTTSRDELFEGIFRCMASEASANIFPF